MSNAVQSPCIKNCSLDEQKICRGCFRRLDEIIDWHNADETTRRAILERVAARRDLQQAITDRTTPLPA